MTTFPNDLVMRALAQQAGIPVPPPEPLVRLRVYSTSAMADHECTFEVGENVVDVPESKVGAIRALVETATPDEIAEIERHYERHYEECLSTGKNTLTWQPSFAGSFRAIMQRDMLPFLSCERLEADGTVAELARSAMKPPAAPSKKRGA